MNTDACNVKPPAVCGDFDVEAMDALFQLVRSKELSNVTVQVKGWVGPIIAQRDKWPPQMHTPADGAEKRAAMAERFNSELAFFLLLAEDHMWWECKCSRSLSVFFRRLKRSGAQGPNTNSGHHSIIAHAECQVNYVSAAAPFAVLFRRSSKRLHRCSESARRCCLAASPLSTSSPRSLTNTWRK